MIKLHKYSICITICLFLSQAVLGRMSINTASSIYAMDEAERHVFFYEKADWRFDILGESKWSVNSSVRWRTDLSDALKQRGDFRIYNTYIQYKNRDFIGRLGRQFLFDGAAGLTLDGISISAGDDFGAGIFAGIESPYDRSAELSDYQPSATFGGRLSYRRRGLLYKISYVSVGSGDREGYQLLGLHSSQKLRILPVSISLRVDYNISKSHLQKGVIRLKGRLSRLEYNLSVCKRLPLIRQDSWFSSFDLKGYTQVRAALDYTFTEGWNIGAAAMETISEEDLISYLEVFISGEKGLLGYRFRTGGHSSLNGFYFDLNHPMSDKVDINLGFNYDRYNNYDAEYGSEALSAVFAARYQWRDWCILKGELQSLSNDYFESDWRIMLTALTSFKTGRARGMK